MNDEMNSMEPRALLEQVNKAISAVLVGGQSYRIGNRYLTRADLGMLKNLRDDLKSQLAEDDSGSLLGRTYAAVFDGR